MIFGNRTLFRSPLNPVTEIKTAAAAVRILFARLPALTAAAVMAEIALRKAKNQPFESLPPPSDDRDALSRRQSGPAILLYRALKTRLGQDPALALTGEVVVAGTVIFLKQAIGTLSRDAIRNLKDADRKRYARTLGERFFNAELRWEEISAENVRFTVTRCHFPDLCAAAGAPELAPLLCRGDAIYFGKILGTVELRRPHTLAEGGPDCPFSLHWKDPD